MHVRVEFTVEPFVDGAPGPHVHAAIDAARRQGLAPEVGPFGTAVEGDVLPGLAAIVSAALDAGAARVVLSVSREVPALRHPFLDAIAPLAEAINATVVPAGRLEQGDIPLSYEGELLGGLRLPRGPLLDRLVAEVERELGGKLADLGREDKQRAVKLLNERGAFDLRRSVDDVADALAVSRITVYNYLNAHS